MTATDTPFQRLQFEVAPKRTAKSDIRALQDLVLFNAIHNPRHAFCDQATAIRNGSDFGYRKITFSQLASMIETCCSRILAQNPNVRPGKLEADGSILKSRPVALFFESGIVLFIYTVALTALHIPCVLLSIRLSAQATQHLLEETRAQSVIVSARTRPIIEHAILGTTNHAVSLYEAMPLEVLLEASLGSRPDPYGYLSTCQHLVREDDRNVLILHSSGTTGLPKAIFLPHRYLLGYAACHELSLDVDESSRGSNLSTLPLFHGFGLLAPCLALSVGKPLCLPPASTIPTGQLVRELLRDHNITSLMTVPTILEELTQMDDFELAVRDLVRLEYIVSGGGGLKIATGHKLVSSGVTVLNHFGATELGALAPIFRPGPSYDWRYLRLRKDMNLRLQPLNQSDENEGACMLVGRPFGCSTDFELQDHLQRNPAKPDSEVKLLGRKDDVIVLATGEKVMPHIIEQRLELNPLIQRAVVIGSGQFEAGVLVEPVLSSNGDSGQMIDTVWEELVKANKFVDQHSRIRSKAAVIVTPPGESIPLSDKGTPQRREVYTRFESEINSAYERLRQMGDKSPVHCWDPENPTSGLRVMVQACLPEHQKPGSWADEEDLIHLGLDSLQAKRLHQMVLQALKACGRVRDANSIPPDFVYKNSSVGKMAMALSHSQDSPSLISDTIASFTAKYSYKDSDRRKEDRHVVVLTGSTGNLGAHLVQVLAKNPQVRQIVCLIRGMDSTQSEDPIDRLIDRQQKALSARGILLSESEWRKINLVSWVAGDEKLGMKLEMYNSVALSVTHVFHGAWPMDFQRRLSSFEGQIRAVRDLVELCRTAHRLRSAIMPRFVLASSIAVVGNYDTREARSVVPEIPVLSTAPLDIAYAEAKLVCERIIESAFRFLRFELNPSIVRIGQISGSQSNGYWTVKEHVPAMVKAAQDMGMFPDLKGSLSWLPVNRAAQILSDVLLQTAPFCLVYHVENPVRQSWADVLTVMEIKLGLKRQPRMPFGDWVAKASRLGSIPATLIAFLQQHFIHMSSGNLILDTRNCRRVSPSCFSVGSVEITGIERYLDFWKSEGFLK